MLALASRLESILFHRHLLLNSAGTLYYCRCSISSVFCNRSSYGIAFSYRRSIELVPLIRSRLPLYKWNRLTGTALFSAFLNYSSILFVLAKVWRVGRTFRHLPSSSAQAVQFPIFRARNGVSFPFRRNGTERNRHRFNGAYCSKLYGPAAHYTN